MQEAAELRGEDEVDENHGEAQCRDRVADRIRHLLRGAAELELISGRQRDFFQCFLHVARDRARRVRGRHARPHLNQPLQIAALDLAFRICRREVGDLAQRDHARTAVGVGLATRQIDLVEIRNPRALVLRQTHQYLMIFTVRAFPLAGVFARDHGASGGDDGSHRHTQITCEFTIDGDIQRRAGRLVGAFDINGAFDRFQFRDDFLRDAIELADFRAHHENLYRTIPADAHFEPRDAGEALANRVVQFLLRARACFLVGQFQSEPGATFPDIARDAFDLGEFAQRGFDLLGFADGVVERGADRRLDAGVGPVLIGLRHEFRAEERYQREACEERERGGPQHDAAIANGEPIEFQMRALEAGSRVIDKRKFGYPQTTIFRLERPAQYAIVGDMQPIHHRRLFIERPFDWLHAIDKRWWIVPDGGQHRVKRERHKQRHQHRDRDGNAELIKEQTDDAAHERHRQEHRDDGECGRHHGKADFLRGFDGCLVVALPHRKMAHNIFTHHDCIVDQNADRQ